MCRFILLLHCCIICIKWKQKYCKTSKEEEEDDDNDGEEKKQYVCASERVCVCVCARAHTLFSFALPAIYTIDRMQRIQQTASPVTTFSNTPNKRR